MKRLVLIALLLTAWAVPAAAVSLDLEYIIGDARCEDRTRPSASAKWDDLLIRNGLFFKKFTNIPFSGRLLAPDSGLFCDGTPTGHFKWHRENGDPWAEGYYKDGFLHYSWTSYTKDGQLAEDGWYKRGKRSSEQKFLNDQYGKAPSLSWSASRLVKPDAPKMSGATCHYGSGIYENGRKVACLKGTPANRCFIPRKQAKYDC